MWGHMSSLGWGLFPHGAPLMLLLVRLLVEMPGGAALRHPCSDAADMHRDSPPPSSPPPGTLAASRERGSECADGRSVRPLGVGVGERRLPRKSDPFTRQGGISSRSRRHAYSGWELPAAAGGSVARAHQTQSADEGLCLSQQKLERTRVSTNGRTDKSTAASCGEMPASREKAPAAGARHHRGCRPSTASR